MDSAYHIAEPLRLTTAVVFASPHSGRAYPDDLMARTVLDPLTIRSSEDAYVDELFAAAPEFGAPLLTAVYPRAYLDLNRSARELDPAVIDGIKAKHRNPRVASGLGVIPRVVANGRAIYRGKLTHNEANARLARGWYPYHRALDRLLSRAHDAFGQAVLVDCHSMPHEALENHAANLRPHIILGDRFGSSASEEIVDALETAFVKEGFRVTRNIPFAGAFMTLNYGKPALGRHAVQVEIDRRLYLNEQTLERNADFTDVQRKLTGAIGRITAFAQSQPLVAE